MPAFLDANIPTYAAGRDHPLKEPCSRVLRLAAAHPDRFVTDAEVLQELLHYYLARGAGRAGCEVVLAFAELMAGRTEPVLAEDVVRACRLAAEVAWGIPARDLLHAAVMERVGAVEVISADRDFDRLNFLRRLDPTEVASWTL